MVLESLARRFVMPSMTPALRTDVWLPVSSTSSRAWLVKDGQTPRADGSSKIDDEVSFGRTCQDKNAAIFYVLSITPYRDDEKIVFESVRGFSRFWTKVSCSIDAISGTDLTILSVSCCNDETNFSCIDVISGPGADLTILSRSVFWYILTALDTQEVWS